ncbi:MAG: sugar transferase [Opitutaceae bacterium]|nr:sugar transferase [Cytophagales bacterium]
MAKNSPEFRLPLWKRAFDILFSLGVIVAISPVLLTVAAIIRLSSKGPIVYKSKRVGSNYRIFDFYKFRSMYTDADQKLHSLAKTNNQYASKKKAKEQDVSGKCAECIANNEDCKSLMYFDDIAVCEKIYIQNKKDSSGQAFMKISNDPRITPIGHFLRNSSIDELPQLFNVLLGDMSIVGNRPLPLYEAEKLTTDQQSLRFLAPAGITGLWQVSKRGQKEMSEDERMELDNIYAKNHSLLFDIKIILKTFPALLQKDNV